MASENGFPMTRFEVPFLRNQRITEHHSLGIFLKLCLKFPIIEKKIKVIFEVLAFPTTSR